MAAGPIGLGLLRSAPAAGALITALLLSRHPVERYIGPKMFAVVAIYGATTIAFGLSTWLPLSMLALAVLGAADSLSIVIRFSLVQIETPDDMRGRVSASIICSSARPTHWANSNPARSPPGSAR